MKRFFALALALLMIVGTFASCGISTDVLGESDSQSDVVNSGDVVVPPVTGEAPSNGNTPTDGDTPTDGETPSDVDTPTDGETPSNGAENEECDHQGGNPATCKTESICELCNQPYGGLDSGNHEGTADSWTQTATTHKKVYSCCDAVAVAEASHTMDGDTCSECGYVCAHTTLDADEHSCALCKQFVKHTYENNQCTSCGLELADATISVGDVIYFGSYPQSAASGSFTAGTWVKDNNVWYTDITSGNNKYRGVKTSESGSVSWFRYDPIKWKVLAVEGKKALILSELVIDSQPYQSTISRPNPDQYNKEYSYNENNTYANNYADSTIREWLTTTFYNNAFSALQKGVIAMTTVDNNDTAIGDYSNGNKFFCDDTEDKIFLLSKGEVKYTAYGFTYTKNETINTTKQKGTSAYSYKVITANGYEPTSGAWWWIRTPAYSATREYSGTPVDTPNKSDLAHNIKAAGTIWSTVVDTASGGVVPAMWIYY